MRSVIAVGGGAVLASVCRRRGHRPRGPAGSAILCGAGSARRRSHGRSRSVACRWHCRRYTGGGAMVGHVPPVTFVRSPCGRSGPQHRRPAGARAGPAAVERGHPGAVVDAVLPAAPSPHRRHLVASAATWPPTLPDDDPGTIRRRWPSACQLTRSQRGGGARQTSATARSEQVSNVAARIEPGSASDSWPRHDDDFVTVPQQPVPRQTLGPFADAGPSTAGLGGPAGQESAGIAPSCVDALRVATTASGRRVRPAAGRRPWTIRRGAHDATARCSQTWRPAHGRGRAHRGPRGHAARRHHRRPWPVERLPLRPTPPQPCTDAGQPTTSSRWLTPSCIAERGGRRRRGPGRARS